MKQRLQKQYFLMMCCSFHDVTTEKKRQLRLLYVAWSYTKSDGAGSEDITVVLTISSRYSLVVEASKNVVVILIAVGLSSGLSP